MLRFQGVVSRHIIDENLQADVSKLIHQCGLEWVLPVAELMRQWAACVVFELTVADFAQIVAIPALHCVHMHATASSRRRTVKIAVCCAPDTLMLGPFGRGSDLFIWDVEGNNIVNRQAVRQQGGCCGGLASSVRGVDIVLCAGIGHGALNHLVQQGTPVAMPQEELTDAEAVVRLWLSGASDRFYVAAGECGHPAGSCGTNGSHHHEAHEH